MNKQLFFTYLMAAISFSSLNAVNPQDVFFSSVALGDKDMAQAIYKFLPVGMPQTLAKSSYNKAFGAGSADAELKATPTDEGAVGDRFKELMTAPGEPGTALVAKFGSPV